MSLILKLSSYLYGQFAKNSYLNASTLSLKSYSLLLILELSVTYKGKISYLTLMTL